MPIIMGVRFRPKLMSALGVQTGSFRPGGNQRGVSDAPSFQDAADGLVSGVDLPLSADGPGVLLTADG